MLRDNQRALNKAMRDLDRERMHLETQEKKVIADIKKMAPIFQSNVQELTMELVNLIESKILLAKIVAGFQARRAK